MSRAYRIEVRESEKRTIRASDEIGTCLDLLEILSPEEMGELLRAELTKRGFTEEGGKLVKEDGPIRITVDPCNGDVILKTDVESGKTFEVKKEGVYIDDIKGSQTLVKSRLEQQVADEIERKAEQQQQSLQNDVSKALEQAVRDFQPELSDIVNQVTKEALKKKAAQLGRVQEVSEDAATGSLTITVEV